MLACELKQAIREAGKPVLIDARQGQREQKAAWFRAAGGQVGKINRKSLVAERRRVDAGQKVNPFDQRCRC